KLFPRTSEAGPLPAAAVVCVPGDPPVYLVVHSSDTGECPVGQCVLYGSTSLPGDEGHMLLKTAVENVVKSANPVANLLWSLMYTALGSVPGDDFALYQPGNSKDVCVFPPPSLDIVFDDVLLDQVKAVWSTLIDGDESSQASFLVFEDREPVSDEDDE
ncbi:Rab proteins geranylgeranyltransferase component A, partial [Ascosphaera aggregata]